MKMFILLVLAILCFPGAMAWANSFAGTYAVQSESGTVVLTIYDDPESGYYGTLTGSGISYSLSGYLENGILKGYVEDEPISFRAELSGDVLNLTLEEVDENDNPVPGTSQRITMRRDAGAAVTQPEKPVEEKTAIIVNNKTLTAKVIGELTEMYGITPKPGNYWYDSRSGLYGVVGYQAYGFMYPGHELGELQREASAGNTSVIVNNRELPQNEWAVWSYILGYWIQPGNYWLDANGNAGYVGNSLPVVNLYQAAQQNGYRGQGGSGDNFWTTRFSAGNYDSGNTRGYVSVPGYGPVGYGFD